MLALVSGYSGVGKTSIVARLQEEVESGGGLFISGKYDQICRCTPYLGISGALTQLAHRLERLSPEVFAARAEEIRSAVSELGRVILDLAPALAPVLGDPPEVPTLPGIEARNRCAQAFRRFIDAASGSGHPLVLFLDDIQWVDDASLDLFRAIACDEAEVRIGGLLIVAAYRENEVDASHPFSRAIRDAEAVGLSIKRISLPGLALNEVRGFLSDVLDPGAISPRPETLAFADALHTKTAGNPFFIRLVLQHLHDTGILAWREGHWTWDPAAVAAIGVTENVAELLSVRLNKLGSDVRSVLATAACLGSSFPIRLLGEALDDSPAFALDRAVHEGLMEVKGENAAFVHDRIQQAALALVPAKELPSVRLAVGRRILESVSPEAMNGRIYVAAAQFLASVPLLDDPKERIDIARLLLRAGSHARGCAAFSEAYDFLTAGISLLPPDPWKDHYNLALDLHREAQLAAHASAHYTEAEAIFVTLNRTGALPLALARCTSCQVNQLLVQGRYRESMDLGLAFMERLGMGFPASPEGIERGIEAFLPEADEFLRESDTLEDLPGHPPMEDPKQMAAVAISNDVAGSIYFLGEWRLYILLCLRAFVWTARYGPCISTGINILRLTQAYILFRNDYSAVARLGTAGLIAARQQGDCYWLGRTLFYHTMFCSHWYRPVRESLALGREGCAVLRECGDLVHAVYNHCLILFILCDSGLPLEEARNEAEIARHEARKQGFSEFESSFVALREMIEGLEGHEAQPPIHRGLALEHSDGAPSYVKAGVEIFATLCAVQNGDWEKAIQIAEAVDVSCLMPGFPMLATYRFLRGITSVRVATLPKTSQDERDHLISTAVQDLQQFLDWALLYPRNFSHRALLLEAELATARGDNDSAVASYEEAVAEARHNGFLHDEALAGELAARFYHSTGSLKTGDAHLIAAHAAYFSWGAALHVQRLEVEFPFLREHRPVATPVREAAVPADHSPPASRERRVIEALNDSGGCVWDWNMVTGDCYLSPAWKAMLGFEPDELSDRIDEWERLTEPDDLTATYTAIRRYSNSDAPFAQEMRVRCKDGTVKWLLARGRIIERSADGRPLRMVGSSTDITAQKQNEESLRASERRLLLAFDSVGDGVWDWDMATDKVYYSSRWKSLLGYAEEDIGDSIEEWRRLTVPEDFDKTFGGVRQHIETGEPFAVEFRMRCKDGSVKWILGRGKVISRDKDGQPLRMIGTNTDITDRKRAEQEIRQTEDLYRRAIIAADAVPYLYDYGTETYLFMGEGVLELTGYTSEEMTPLLWQKLQVKVILYDEASGLGWDEAQRRGRAGEFSRWRSDNLIRTRDGQQRWIADAAVNQVDEHGKTLGSVGVLTDITDRRRTQEELEAIVRERTASLEASNKELEAFAQSAAHDLRSPLACIAGFSQLLREKHAAKLDEKAQQYLRQIRKESQRMSQLIGDLLLLSRVRQSELRRESVDMSGMIRRIVAELRLREPERKVDVKIAPGASVQADPSLLRIALTNLVGNAWKYTSKKENAQIEFGICEKDGSPSYYIKDNGAGFDMSQAGRLFSAFHRLHTGAEFPGTGIGLSIVQRIIERHGGHISAEATPEQGATFYFTLP